MVDYCMGSTLWKQTTDDERIATVSISINYVQTATEGDVVCTTELDRRNRRLAVLRSEVRADDGRLLATAIGSYTIFPRKGLGSRRDGPSIETNGQTIYYEEHGEGEPLLCVMGLSADTLAWVLQVPAFSERYRTIIFDNRDVGQSSRATGEYEIADMARTRSAWPTRSGSTASTCWASRWAARSRRRWRWRRPSGCGR